MNLHTERYCELCVHASLCIRKDLLILLIKTLALFLEHLPLGTDSTDKINDILTVTAAQKSVEDFLARIPVLDPLYGIVIDAVDKLQCFLLGDNGLYLGSKLLVVTGNVYYLSLINKQGLQYVILLGTLMIKAHILDIVDLAYTAAAVNYSFSLLKAHTLSSFFMIKIQSKIR